MRPYTHVYNGLSQYTPSPGGFGPKYSPKIYGSLRIVLNFIQPKMAEKSKKKNTREKEEVFTIDFIKDLGGTEVNIVFTYC